MGIPGYTVTLKRSGTPTAFTNQAFSTYSTVANTWIIGSTTRSVWDRSSTASFTFRETSTSSAISSTDIAYINYLFGIVRFNSTHATMVGSGVYMPLAAMVGAYSYTLTQAADVLDDTDFTSTGYRSKQLGLHDVSLTVTRWDNVATDSYFDEVLMGSTANAPGRSIVAEIQPDPNSSGPYCRGWFKVETHNRSGDVASLEGAEVSLSLDGEVSSLGNVTFGWSDND